MELTSLKGIGEKSKKALEQKGIFCCEDLAKMLPARFYQVEKPTAFEPNKKATTIAVQLSEKPRNQFVKGGLVITRTKAEDLFSHRIVSVVWFNQRFAANAYKKDGKYVLFGNSQENQFQVVLAKPLDKQNELVGTYPIYPKTGIKRNVIQSAIFEAQEKCAPKSIIPEQIEKANCDISLADAHKIVHAAKDKQELDKSLFRIELEKAVSYLVDEGKRVLAQKIVRNPLETSFVDEILKDLPFVPTGAQNDAISDIMSDFSKPASANRLIMGEVGSGKTLVAFVAALVAIKNGFQVAFMAPTEILAQQHYESFQKFFAKRARAVCITSSKQNKKSILSDIKDGGYDVVFGTHIISLEHTIFKNLGLVVIDEQQRFGVETRAKLVQKSKTHDCLSLSATPIPRSVLLALSGVLETSKMAERPHPPKIETHFVGKNKEEDMWNFVSQQEKAFVVCPKIEEDDPFEDSSSSVEKLEKLLVSRFGKENIVRVDGKMSREKQQQTMQEFKDGAAKILVATTVVEVGVDVPQASVMVIRGADRFGLSSLHQLRGRIGRDGKTAHCFIMLDQKPSEEALERLTFFKDHTNGFDIAEFDFNMRGAGDAFGTKQSGEFVLPFSHETLQKAKQIVSQMDHNKFVFIVNN